MKTPLLYGFASALIGSVVMFALHFAGFYDSVEKLPTAQIVGGVISLITIVTCMILAIRERQRELPAGREWGYGSAFGTAFLTGIVSMLVGTVVWFLYAKYVNPGSVDVMVEIEAAKMEAKGATDAQIDGMRSMMGPVFMTVMAVIGQTIMFLVLALIVAIFFRKAPAGARAEVATTLM